MIGETQDRLMAMLSTALGEAGQYLLDNQVIEIMANPDGKLWIDRLGSGRSDTGFRMSPENVERLIYVVASSIGSVCSKDSPILSAELPGSGARFQGLLPPIVAGPTISIRKKALKVFSLEDYVASGIMSAEQSCVLREAVAQRKNILIVGGTGSGKTTLANAVLNEISRTNDRVILIEDTIELQCSAPDTVAMRSKDGLATMRDLLKATLRLRPDRIVIGEVRGPEALDLLKAWNTGHPGGCATIHADSASKSLFRLEQLVHEAGVQPSREFIAEAVNLIVFIEKTATGRKVSEVVELSWKDGYHLRPITDLASVSQ